MLGYLDAYRQVLVTTLREFLLLGVDERGKPVVLEQYSLAPTEAAFWALANHPRNAEKEHGARFLEFLKRVLLSGATLASPQDLAWFLASYAREARFLAEVAELPALDAVRRSMEETLGVKFEGEKGEHFFRSTLVQTLFYGLFASWVLWSHDHEPGDSARFEWRQAAWTLRVPVVQALFTQIATPTLLGSLGLVPVLDLAAAALNRVDRRAFFAKFEKHHAVQYFYEPFLEAFDPELRKELGVWYTPPEIVEYMVARVDTVLREELGVADGLADPSVYVLDPCCGTGAYLVEVLEKIAQTLDEKGSDALVAGEVKKAAKERVFGFEILPAPFVIAHMQLGLLLQNMHLPLERGRAGGRVSDQRADRLGVAARPRSSCRRCRSWRPSATPPRRSSRTRADPGDPGQPALQRLRGHGHRRGAGADRRLPHHQEGGGAAGPGPERPLRALLPHGRTADRGEDRRGHRLLHLQLLLAGRPVVHRHARAVLGGVRQDLDRLSERRQVQDRQD